MVLRGCELRRVVRLRRVIRLRIMRKRHRDEVVVRSDGIGRKDGHLLRLRLVRRRAGHGATAQLAVCSSARASRVNWILESILWNSRVATWTHDVHTEFCPPPKALVQRSGYHVAFSLGVEVHAGPVRAPRAMTELDGVNADRREEHDQQLGQLLPRRFCW